MSEKILERNEISAEYTWDLTSLFASDEEWEKDLEKLDEKIEAAAAYRDQLKDAKAILAYFKTSAVLETALENLFCYASLRRSEDTREDKGQTMYGRIYGKYVEAETKTAFASPEILSLPEKELEQIAASEELKDYRYVMTKLLRKKQHMLTADQEELLGSFGESFAAPRETAMNLMNADMVFDSVIDGSGKEVSVESSNYILLQTSTDRTLRENAFRSLYKGYRQHINTLAAAYAGEVKTAVTEARIRHYPSSREMMTGNENVPVQVYDNLIASVHKYMPLMYRYVALRKKLLNVPELHYYDLYAPLSGELEEHYTYEEAKEMVLSAVKPLGEEYRKTVKQAFQDRWVDVYPNKGKRSGAFSSGTYTSNPYILTNFVGTLDSVSTLAHEMGHSMHTWYSNHTQQHWNADYTIFVAEVASTCNENLLIEQLLSDCTDPVKRMALLNQYLEGFKGTMYRQTMFAEFEMEAHRMAEEGQPLNATALNGLYHRLIQEYFGDELVIDEEVDYEWARIPHFYTPFYVYKYATSYAASAAISERILQEGAPAAEQYLKFLSLGGSMDPIDELKTAGVDLTKQESIDFALEKFEKVLEEAEKLAEELKK